jgi:putative flippase GtrA
MPAAPAATGLVADEAGGNARSARLGASRGRHAAPLSASAAHGVRFTIFSAIGGVIFLLGLGLQAALTGHWHVPAFASCIAQAVVSVELSFVLNRWLTWRDRDTALRAAFGRVNAQKAVTVALNAAIYAGLLRLGMNYLLANVLLTIVFTVMNYAAGDKFVFSPRKARSEEIAVAEPHTVPLQAIRLAGPPVSVVIPCRNNEATIGAAIMKRLALSVLVAATVVTGVGQLPAGASTGPRLAAPPRAGPCWASTCMRSATTRPRPSRSTATRSSRMSETS